MTAPIRTFPTGATRDTDAGKLDFDGFLCPLVLERYAKYMHKHRELPDGTLRPSDNWKQGIPLVAYRKSIWRHFQEFWKAAWGYPSGVDIEDAICASIFNYSGYLHELLKAKIAPMGGAVVPHAIAAAYLRDRAESDDDARCEVPNPAIGAAYVASPDGSHMQWVGRPIAYDAHIGAQSFTPINQQDEE